MKHIFKKSVLLSTFVLFQLINFVPVFALPSEVVSLDSLQPNVSPVKFSENAPLGKISTPTKNMLRKADNEIHRNMKADLAAASSLMRSWKGIISSDLHLTFSFYKTVSIDLPTNMEIGEEKLNLFFLSENLEIKNKKLVEKSDFHINKSFYSSN